MISSAKPCDLCVPHVGNPFLQKEDKTPHVKIQTNNSSPPTIKRNYYEFLCKHKRILCKHMLPA